jgi:phenylpropionate dioxygenase-like ring-hydroxylating dioxygenase large terminal subunit
MKPATVHRLLDEIDYEFERDAPPNWFPDLPRLQPDRYLDKTFFELEMQALRNCWLIIGTVHEFPTAGSYKVFDKWGTSGVIIVRGHDDRIRAFHNTCRHRGAPIVADQCGVVRRLNCQMHSWSYELDGSLAGVPGRRDFHANLDKAALGLKPVACDIWRGFVFINLDPDPSPLLEWLGPIADEATWFDGLRIAASNSMVVDANWKIAIESNIEVYHVTTVHPETVALGLDYRGSTHELYNRGHSRMIVPSRTYDSKTVHAAAQDGDAQAALMSNANVSYLLFPFHLTPGGRNAQGQYGVTLQTFWPIAVDRTLLEWHTLVPDWGDGPPPASAVAANAYFSGVMDEDTASMAPIQRSIASGAFDGALISYHERRIYHHEASIDRHIGIERVPERLRVPQLLQTVD